jgi:hypothetical protein
MENKMKTKMKSMLTVLALGASAFAASAQDNNQPWNNSSNDWQRPRHRPPPLPIVQALDVNHDGVIDADEIANAPAELKTLDKNGDGVLTRDEICPPRPAGPDGQVNNYGGGDNMPPGPPPGDDDGNNPPPGPPPGDQ